MRDLFIHGGRLIDPESKRDEVGNLLVSRGRIAEAGPNVEPIHGHDTETIDAGGWIVSPGLIDLHVEIGEPGREEDETVETGTAAGLAGGFTTLCVLPTTHPVVDSRSGAEYLRLLADRADACRVLAIGAVTRHRKGEELAEIGQLSQGGAVGFSDADLPVANAEIMRRALEYTRMFNRPILHRAAVPELIAGGVMHEGRLSTLLGLRGMPRAAEEIMVGRDIALAELTGGHVHLMSLSCASSVDMVRRAKARGVRVTCDVTPHHLSLTDNSLRSYESSFKCNPPLRTTDDVRGLIAGLQDGTVDAISSDHQPRAAEKITGELDRDPYGMVGLETALGLCAKALVQPGHMLWSELLAKFTSGPKTALRLDTPSRLTTGESADLTLIDPDSSWTVTPAEFRSKSRNTPFSGWELPASVRATIVGGDVRYRSGLRE